MRIQYFIPLACALLFGCYADKGINPSGKYPKTMSSSQTVKELPKCNASAEGLAVTYDHFFEKKVYVCADNVWIFLRDE